MKRFFITGIGTGIGKTLVASMLTEALEADYWKPVQAGMESTDSALIRSVVCNSRSVIHPEVYALKLPASPHIAAREESVTIDIDLICRSVPTTNNTLLIEGAGGLMVPLNDDQFICDLALALDATVILVSRNYLGSINHSLLTAMACRSRNIPVAGWIFNDQYLHYEEEIVRWSGYPRIASIPFINTDDVAAIRIEAMALKESFNILL